MMISLMMIIFFAEWLTGEKCLGVQRFSPYKYPTRREQDFKVRRTSVQTTMNEVVQ